MTAKIEVTLVDIAAEADPVSPQAEVARVDIKSDVGFVAPRAENSYVNLRIGLNYTNPKNSINYVKLTGSDFFLDSNLMLSKFYDTISFTDSVAFAMGLGYNINDTLLPEDAMAFDVEKTLTDQFNFADAVVVVWSPIRDFTETLTVTESLFTVFGKGLSDAITPSDSFAISFDTVFADVTTVLDTMAFATSIVATDSLTPTEALILDIGKSLAETLVMGDTPTIVNLSIETSIFNESVFNTFYFNQ